MGVQGLINCRATVSLAAIVASLAFCSGRSASAAFEVKRTSKIDLEERSSPKVHSVQRGVMTLDDGTRIAVLIDKPAFLNPKPDSRLLKLLRRGRTRLAVGDEFEAYQSNPAVNCHAFACNFSNLPGIPTNVWINSLRLAEGEKHRPLKKILDTAFERVLDEYGSKVKELAVSPLLMDHDLILFRDVRAIGQFVHSGTIFKNDGENWVRHKYGENLVVESPLEEMKQLYAIDFIDIYRRRSR